MGIEQLQSPVFEAFSEIADQQFLYICELETNLWRWTPSAVLYFGLPGEYVRDLPDWWMKRVHPDDADRVTCAFANLFSGVEKQHRCEYRILNAREEYVWILCRGCMVDDGDKRLCAGILTNMSSGNKFDAITGLYSFHEFLTYMDGLLKSEASSGGVLLFSIDHFRELSDTTERKVSGNSLLSTYARALIELIPAGSLLFRMESHKLALLCPGAGRDELLEAYRRIAAVGESGFSVRGESVHFTISAGAVLYPDHTGTGNELYTRLEYALELSRKKMGSELVFYTAHSHQSSLRVFSLQQRLRENVRAGCAGFSLFYQPIVSNTSKRLVGAEALLRWSHPEFGKVPPVDFIPLLERSGDIVPVGKWVVSTALEQVKKWQTAQPDMKIYINVSYLQLVDESFRPFVLAEVERTGFPVSQLVLELTESCDVANPDQLKAEFRRFREAGIQIALDDFGTGYSSLSVLRELPTDWIKIDHQFVAQIVNNDFDKAMTEYLIGLCKKLGIQVCVEGIETREIQNIIEQFSPNVLQGYFYSFPIAPAEFEEQFIEAP